MPKIHPQTMPTPAKRRITVTTLSALTLLAMLLLGAMSPGPAFPASARVGAVEQTPKASRAADLPGEKSHGGKTANGRAAKATAQQGPVDMECEEWGISNHVGGFGTCDNGK